MRILVCTDPGNTHSEKLLKSLGEREKVGVYWMGEKQKSGFEIRQIPHFPVFIKKPINFRGLWRLSQELPILFSLLFFRPDIIHVHVNALLVRKFRRWAANKPIIFTAWGHIPLELRQGDFGKSISDADGFTTDSFTLLNELHEIPGCASKPGEIFRFGVNLSVFTPTRNSNQLKADLTLPFDCKIVYSPRSLRTNYNHETLVRAIPLILEKAPNTYFLFANHHGHRYLDAIAYQEKLKNEIQRFGVVEHVRFLEHRIEHARVAELFQSADVTVSIPLEDGFPATILEAMACGSPLVVSNLPDYEGVVDKRNATLVPAKDVQTLSEAVVALLTDPDLWLRQQQAGLETVHAKGDLTKEVDKLLSFYNRFL